MTRLAVILMCLALATCGADASQTQAIDLGAEVTLAPGATVSVKSAKLKVRFVAVIEDSRCPRGLTCVWAGEVKVSLAIQESSKAEALVEIVEGGSTVAGGYRVTLVRVVPAPANGMNIVPQDYRVTLRVNTSGVA